MANACIIKPLPIVGEVSTAGSPQAGAAANLFNDYAGVICQLACDAGLNAAAVQFDLGADKQIDTLLVFGANLVPDNGLATVSYATAAQGPFTGGYVTDNIAPYAGSAAMSSGDGVTLWSSPSPVTARYVRLTYYAGRAELAFRASRIVVGKRIQLERNFSYGASFGVRDLGSLDFSARGVLLRRRGTKLRTVGLTFSSARKDEVETSVQPLLERIGNTEMVALITDPAPDAQRQNHCFFGPLVGDLATVRRNAAAYEAKVNLVSIF